MALAQDCPESDRSTALPKGSVNDSLHKRGVGEVPKAPGPRETSGGKRGADRG